MSNAPERALAAWFRANSRPLPWRDSGTSAWGVLLSEVMSQQTPVARVSEPWNRWMSQWPTPSDLAAADPALVIREWGNLGYPRRALRLRECAAAIVEDHGGEVPHLESELLSLPGIGEYTAAAVAAFAFGKRTTLLDTNIRRVLGRAFEGIAAPRPHITRADRELAQRVLPERAQDSVIWNEALMELGATVCAPRAPRCGQCPLFSTCAWRQAGYPDAGARVARPQTFEGTDRQIRGRMLKVLRDSSPTTVDLVLASAQTDLERARRVLDTLLADGLAHTTPHSEVALGPDPHA